MIMMMMMPLSRPMISGPMPVADDHAPKLPHYVTWGPGLHGPGNLDDSVAIAATSTFT